MVGVVNSKYFISAWNEVIQSNGHNFWTVCRMTLKKKTKWREFYWLSFALNFSFVGAKTRILWPFNCCQTKIFFTKNWHRKKSWHWCNQSTWNSYMMKLIFFCPIYIEGFPGLMLGFCTLWGLINCIPQKLWQLLWDVFLLTKCNIQFQKVDCCLQRTPFRFRKNHCS